jgi:hypothetical protein
MADEYVIIGKDGDKRAQEAKDIGSLIVAHRDGRKEEILYHPTSANPGQDVMEYIDDTYPEAKAIITGQMAGPPNYNKRAVIREKEENINRIVEKYNNGEYDPEIDRCSLEKKAEEAPAKTPKQDGSGKGERANKGREGCPPEEQEEYGRGSGTKEGRAAEGKPKGTDYESKKTYERSESGEASEEDEGESPESGEGSESREGGESSGESGESSGEKD